MRRITALSACFALALPAPAHAIVNADGAGPVPYQALVRVHFSAQADGRCGAIVRDALHVITAAHCTFDETARSLEPWALAPSALTVVAGVSRTDATRGAQRRRVVAVSSDPWFATAERTAVHDDALLTLDRPLDLRDPARVAALAPVAPGARPAAGRFSGFGLAGAGRRGRGVLRFASLDVLRPSACARYGRRFVASAMLCAGRSGADGAMPGGCNGDSGGALASAAGLEGIASFVGPNGCGERRYPTVFTRVADPVVNAFLTGSDPVPRPAVLARPAVVSATPRVVAGSVVRCTPGRWAGADTFTYEFDRALVVGGAADGAQRVVVGPASTRDTYRLTGADFASGVFCVVRAGNAGGTVAVASANALGPAGAAAVRDGAAPTARFTRVVCEPGRCTARLVAADDAPLVRAGIDAHVGRRSLRVRALGAGRYLLTTPRLTPGRHRLVVALTDRSGNRQARPATIRVTVR